MHRYNACVNQQYTIEYLPPLIPGEKRAASAGTYREVEDVMQRIYKENPSYWPYGLSIPMHTNMYAIRDKGTEKIAGFVGWQEFNEGGKKVGAYSIGILPEYRKHGFAKEAVAKLLMEKSGHVDRVCAFIMPKNGPSHALANSLSVPIVEKF